MFDEHARHRPVIESGAQVRAESFAEYQILCGCGVLGRASKPTALQGFGRVILEVCRALNIRKSCLPCNSMKRRT